MTNKLFQNRRPGFYIAFFSSLLAALGAVAYLIVYMATAAEEPDRVFNYLTFGLMLGGGVLGVIGELLRLRFGVLLAVAGCGVALANHLVETAYPLADVLTGVAFFGGNFPMALIFAIIFGLTAVCLVVSAFMEHNK